MEFTQEIIEAVRDETRFIRLTLSAPRAASPWLKIAFRPVEIKGARRIQAVQQGPQKQVARNLTSDEFPTAFAEYLALGFTQISLQCIDRDMHIRITKKSRVLISRGRPSLTALPADLSHDREKEYPLPDTQPDEFLEELGVMKDGNIYADMRDKFRQINQFLIVMSHAKLFESPPAGPIEMVDCGCGRAFLTLAAYHYFHGKRGLPMKVTGVDANEEVISRAKAFSDKLGFQADVDFVCTRIGDYVPPSPPAAVLSLHACDTATDEAVSQAVKWGAELILAAPCCQHELHKQIARSEFAAVLRHGILRERTSDILTDAFRAAALRVMGYRAEVIEFISPEYTSKNIMIRAEKIARKPSAAAVAEYLSLKQFWQVTPAIETLLGEPFSALLRQKN